MNKFIVSMIGILVASSTALAHDSWVQTNTNLVRPGDNLHIDLMFGNHGNEHRDFKLAGKLDLASATLAVIDPDRKQYDLKSKLADLGYAPKEGFWTGMFAPAKPGLYLVAHTSDKVVTYAPARSIKSAKAYFVASASLDKVTPNNPGFDRVLGHPLELVPVSNPVTPMGPGTPIKVRLLFHGKPLAGTVVSFIPRGETLNKDFDPRFERKTDAQGRAEFTPTAGNYYLVVAHHQEPAPATAKDYTMIKYAATMTVLVPQICPCCGE